MLRVIVPALAIAMGPATEVPVQRPAGMGGPETESASESASASASESASESVTESESASVTESESVAEDPLVERGVKDATITGRLVDTELVGAPLSRAEVSAVCTCLEEPRVVMTDAKGNFVFEDLPAGVYTIVATRGGRPTHEVVAVAPGDEADVELTVGPPTTTEELDERDYRRQRANTMIAIGGVAALGAIVMLLASALEQRKPACNFGLDNCADAPRPGAIYGLGIGGGILAITGGALIGVGAHRIRKLNARVSFDDRAVGISVSGRF